MTAGQEAAETGAAVDTPTPAERAGRRTKNLLLLGIVVVAGTALAAATQDWFTIVAARTDADTTTVVIPGSDAAPALTALALASLALAGALAISGRGFRVVLGVLQVIIGGCVALSASTALGDPVRSGASLISEATGIAGSDSIAALVSSVGMSAWPTIALIVSAAMVVLGIAVLATGSRWPGARRKRSSRFETSEAHAGAASVDAEGEIDPVVTWDELSRGDDPTGDGTR